MAALRRLLVVLSCALLLGACASDVAPLESATAPPATPAASASPRGGGPAVYVPPAGSPPVAGHPWFLAIGDSITSGFTIDPARAGVNSSWALQLQDLLAKHGRAWTLYDVACSGETLESYRTRCHDRTVNSQVLHGRSQEQAALDAVAADRADLKAILVDLGSNDLLRVLRSGGSLDTTLASMRTALTATVAELQQAAPGVPVILCNYYDPLANIYPAGETQLAQVNAAVTQIAAARGAALADFHAAINTAPPPDQQLCQYVDCVHLDVHPTVAGHARLAQTALAALGIS